MFGVTCKNFQTQITKISGSFTRVGNLATRVCLVRVKAFPENISFSGNAIFRKGKCIQVFGCLRIRFMKNQFRCLVRTSILRKMTSVLRKINSNVWFGQTFYGK